jgi:hypothetical protein
VGEHKLPRPRLAPGHEAHIRESRLPSARDGYAEAPAGCVSESTRMWAARYADDVTALLSEIDHLRSRPERAVQSCNMHADCDAAARERGPVLAHCHKKTCADCGVGFGPDREAELAASRAHVLMMAGHGAPGAGT